MKKILKSLFEFLRQNRSGAFASTGLVLVSDIFSIQPQSDLTIFLILGLYLFFIKVLIIKSKTTFLFCFFILGLLLLEFIITGASVHSEKASVWLFLFVAIGIIQELVYFKNEKS